MNELVSFLILDLSRSTSQNKRNKQLQEKKEIMAQYIINIRTSLSVN